MKKITLIALALGAYTLLAVWSARAQTHQGNTQGLAQQNIYSHADVTISASASPAAVASPSTIRIYALCQNTGATYPVRVGDSTVGSSTGILLKPSELVPIPINGTLYAYSDSGTTVNCSDVIYGKATAIPATATASPSPTLTATPSATPT
jgi:hypothetical protein